MPGWQFMPITAAPASSKRRAAGPGSGHSQRLTRSGTRSSAATVLTSRSTRSSSGKAIGLEDQGIDAGVDQDRGLLGRGSLLRSAAVGPMSPTTNRPGPAARRASRTPGD